MRNTFVLLIYVSAGNDVMKFMLPLKHRLVFTLCFVIIQLGFLIYFTSLIDPNYGKDSRVRFKNKYTETQRLKNILHGMQKLLTLVHRKANVGNSREESCDIETALLFLKNNNVSETVFTNTFEDVTPLGGTDWGFRTHIPCSNKSSAVNDAGKEVPRRQFIPSCFNDYVTLEVRENFNESLPLFKFPDTCLKKIIDKFCTTPFLVPNIIHYIWLGKGIFDFMYFVSILSGHKKQHPCLIFLYYDTLPSGEWWNLLLLHVPNIIPVNVTPPSEISNQKILYVQHKSDILRLQILTEYGGIYLDTDQLLLTSLDKFRNRECTMGMAADGYFGSAVIIAGKNSALIKKWMDSYSAYKPNLWGENSVIMATKLAKQYPKLIHVEKHYCSFYPHQTYLADHNYKWSHSYGIHIYKSGREEQLKQLNFSSIRKLNNTLGAAFRFVLFDNKELCS
ncbi:uncharacterized protein [Magallana gigas]|uniref:uncharacterized protein isoform X1 n=1 Tax=Magallana gigas TaxID=29159 RepID=UPI00334277E7